MKIFLRAYYSSALDTVFFFAFFLINKIMEIAQMSWVFMFGPLCPYLCQSSLRCLFLGLHFVHIHLPFAFSSLFYLGPRDCSHFTLNNIMSFSLDINKSDIFWLFISQAIKIFGQSAFHELAQITFSAADKGAKHLLLYHIGFNFRGE